MTRLALVIASQCRAMGMLDSFPAAARGLHKVLLDPQRGACVEAVPGHPLLSDDEELDPDDVREIVRQAVVRAGEESATLVLAFLGHGFRGVGQDLYFMGRDSEKDLERKSVSVNQLLREAAVEQHIEGVAAIIDTCFAGAAPPSGDDLLAGARAGGKNLAALTSATAGEVAYGFRFSTALTGVLRDGLDQVNGSCPRYLTAGSVLQAVRRRTPGQVPTASTFNDAAFSQEPWLALNARHPGGTTARIPRMRVAPVPDLTPGNVRDLVDRLRAVPVVRRLPQIQEIVAELPAPVPSLVLDPQGRGIDLTRLVRALEQYPADDPWGRLLDLLRAATPAGQQHLIDQLGRTCRDLDLIA